MGDHDDDQFGYRVTLSAEDVARCWRAAEAQACALPGPDGDTRTIGDLFRANVLSIAEVRSRIGSGEPVYLGPFARRQEGPFAVPRADGGLDVRGGYNPGAYVRTVSGGGDPDDFEK